MENDTNKRKEQLVQKHCATLFVSHKQYPHKYYMCSVSFNIREYDQINTWMHNTCYSYCERKNFKSFIVCYAYLNVSNHVRYIFVSAFFISTTSQIQEMFNLSM